jgi:hypothetical protein
MAAENDLAHLRLLREVMRRADNADDALLRDPLVAAVHYSCQALTPTSWLAQCSAERNTFLDTPAQPSNRVLRSRIRDRVGQCAADLSGSTIAPGVTTRCGRSSRSRRVGRHHNPLDAILRAPAVQPMAYLHAPSRHTAPVLMLRSLHLPGEYADPAPGLELPYCRFCHKTVHRDDEGQVSEAELRWRHICHYICGCPAIPAAEHARHDFRTAISALALRSDMQLDVPMSVMDVSLPMDHRTLMALLLDPGSVCTAAPHALPSCARVVSDFLTAIGHAVCTAPLLAECVPCVSSAAARGRCSYEYGLLQRGAGSTQDSENHRVRKPTCTGRRGHEQRHHRYVPSQKRTHARPQKERQDQPDRTEDAIYIQPTPDQPAKPTTAATSTGNPGRYACTEETTPNQPTPD